MNSGDAVAPMTGTIVKVCYINSAFVSSADDCRKSVSFVFGFLSGKVLLNRAFLFTLNKGEC